MATSRRGGCYAIAALVSISIGTALPIECGKNRRTKQVWDEIQLALNSEERPLRCTFKRGAAGRRAAGARKHYVDIVCQTTVMHGFCAAATSRVQGATVLGQVAGEVVDVNISGTVQATDGMCSAVCASTLRQRLVNS